MQNKQHFVARPHAGHSPTGGLSLCRECLAIYEDKHWHYDEIRARQMLAAGHTPTSICGGCEAVLKGYSRGVLTLQGDFSESRAHEVMHLLRHEEEKERAKNPLSRIVDVKVAVGEIEVDTSTAVLARHLGRCVEKACGGDMTAKWLDKEKSSRVLVENLH
jgi:hypothetical protein